MINLCLVVIATQFSETKKRETERMNQERKRHSSSSSTMASDSEPGGCYIEILRYIAHILRKARRRLGLTVRFSDLVRRVRDIIERYHFRKTTGNGRKHRRRHTHDHHSQHPHDHPHRRHSPHHRKKNKKRKKKRERHRTSSELPVADFSVAAGVGTSGCSPQAPRASPEISEIGTVSPPRRLNVLTVMGHQSPSSETLHSPEMLGSRDPCQASPRTSLSTPRCSQRTPCTHPKNPIARGRASLRGYSDTAAAKPIHRSKSCIDESSKHSVRMPVKHSGNCSLYIE